MNFQTAAVAGGAAFILSFLAGLVGGVPIFDIVIRALIWGAVGFGGCLGIESLLRSLVPDLFLARDEAEDSQTDPSAERTVDITLGDDDRQPQGNFVEEMDEDELPVRTPPSSPRETPVPGPAEAQFSGAEPEPPAGAPAPAVDEEMPEIGSFLDAFKPGAPDEEPGEGAAAPAPEYADYAPVDQGSRSNSDMKVNGEVQDPVVLAKAVQTVMRREGQGN